MKIEVNLEDIFCEDGCSTEESISKAIVESLCSRLDLPQIKNIVETKLLISTKKIVDDEVKRFSETFLSNVIDQEIVETSSWGEVKSRHTIRERLMEQLSKQCEFKESSWSSDENVFTKEMKKIISSQFKEFEKEWRKQVDYKFMDKCLEKVRTDLARNFDIKIKPLSE